MDKKKRNSRKNEKGAITLFVLLACLFFVFILSGVYISNLNKIQNQEREVKQIQENYAKDLDRIEEVYEEIVGNIKVTLTQNPGKETWTKENVTLIGNAKVEKGEQTIEYYVFSQNPNPGEIAESEWKKAGNPQEISPTIEVEENGQYYFYVKDNEETIKKATIEVTNIDKNDPTAGTLGGKEYESGTEIGDYIFGTSTDKDVYIYVIDKGSDSESEVTTIYEIKTLKDASTQTYTSEDTVTLTETGAYEIKVKTTDEAGNVTDRDYVVIIDKNIPILTLKHNDATGADYESGTWTKDDLYGEINIDTSSTGKTLEKYQYSYDLGNWNDISSEMAQTRIDYTTTFPMGEDKPDWFTGPINANSPNNSNGAYYFEIQSDGTLKPNNSGKNSTTANSYFEIDLEKFPKTVELEITINATISSENKYDFGYATITESETAPAYNATDGRFIYVSGPTTTADYATTLTGGTKYYLHIGYRKDGSSASNQDTFIINSINLKSDNLSNKIKFYEYTRIENKVTFKLQEEMRKEIYIRAVYEGQGDESKRASKYGSSTIIKIDKTAPIIQTINSTLTSQTISQIDVTVQEDDSKLRGYYISTEETVPTESSTWTEQMSNEFTIEGLNTGTTYYIWAIDNAGNISEKKQITTAQANYSIDDSTYEETLAQAITQASSEGGSIIKLLNDYTDESTVAFDRNVTFDVQSYTLTRSKTIIVNSSKTVEMTGAGKITSESNNVSTITNSGILTISNSVTIENMSTSSSNAPIYTSSSSSVTNINDNVKIIGYYRGIYNYYGKVNVNGGYIEATYSNSSAYGIYNSSSYSKIYIYNGEIKGYYGIYNSNSSALIEITGGKVVGTGAYGIYAKGTTNIYGGRIEGKTYGVYSNATNKVTIGKQEYELSITTPAIYGGNCGIYMYKETYSFNFYNGVVISNTKETAYKGIANLRENHMTYTYLDYEVEQKYCTILTLTVENITMEATPTEYTNGNVIVKITYPYIQGIARQYSEDGAEWKETSYYNEELIISENKTIYARTMDESGIITDENQITVNNIDKEKPTVTVSPDQTQYTVTEENGTADISLTIRAEDTGVSGLNVMQYAWIKEGEEPAYIDFTNEITINKTNLSIGQYNLYLKVTDKAGNEAELQQMRYNVKYQEPVCQIGETKYLTIQEAIEACSKEAGENQTTIEIIKSTDEEFSTYEGQNIIIDLKGYTIGSSSTETPICINNGKLTIIDTSTEKTGKIESLNGTSIVNTTTGEITIGDSSTSIEPNTPTIYGKKIGIKNEGTLNFYDGKIQGTAPIQGKVTNTPEGYGPVSTDYENGITTVQLGIVSGYEARIEWVYYTTVQEAIDATKLYKNGYRDTVTIIKDIQLKEIAEIDTNKNMILDLDRYTLTIVPEKDKVIENYGNLEITDSSTEQTGKIEITSSKTGTSSSKTIQTIAVNNNGILKISEGTINSTTSGNDNYSYGIYNASSGSVTVSGGTVSSSSSYSSIYTYSCGIYNDSSGSVTVSGGTVSSSCSSSSSCGIYNNSIGNVTVNGGTVISSSSSNYTNLSSYGIYNWSTGNVEVSGGTVSSSSSSSSYGIYNYGSGSLTVSGGTVSSSNSSSSSSSCGIYNASSGSITVSGGTVSSSSNNSFSYGIYNSKGNVIITGGTVSSNGYGIYNADSGNVTVEGGAVSSSSSGRNSYGIYNNSGNIIISGGTVSSSSTKYSYGIYNYSSGTIIIGDKSSDTLTREEPNIKGKYTGASSSYDGYGLYNKDGNVEFYNGTVQGSNIALEGTITKIKEGYKIENSTIEDKDTIYLVEKIEEENIVQIESIKYTSLQEAMNSIEENEEKTIEVIKDFELDEVISNTKNIILDLQGHTMTNKYYRIENIGNLKITDTTENKEGKIESIETIIGILNKEGGNINVAGGTVSSSSSSSSSYGIYNDGIGDVIVNGGTVSSSGNGGFSYSYGIYNSKGNVIITGGAVSSSSSGGSSYGIYNASSGRVTVSGGTVSGGDSGIHNISTGSIEVSGGTVSSSIYGIYNRSSGNVEVRGGTVSSSIYGIYNRSSGNVEVRGGTVSSSGGGSSSYGIYNDNSTGSITIGTKGDGLVSEEEPYIKGEYTGTSTSYVGYGIYNTSGKLYYYDGKIEGSTKAVYDTITEIEENTELNYNEDETILTLTTEITDIAQIGEITYATIQEAIEEVGTEQETIKILRNVTYTNNDTSITIPNTKNIKLDLNGYKITSSIPEKVIQNEGKLEIIDTSEEQTGTIITNEETTIKNIEGAQLVISGGTIENRTKQAIYNEGENIIAGGIISSSGNYGIYNASTGSIEVSGGTVRSINNNSNSYGIYNYDSGNVEVRGGTISSSGSYSYGIYNASSGNVTVIGGTVSSSQYGIYNNNTGSITIGAKGDGLVSQEEPKIKGNEYGTYNLQGTLSIYDGKIAGTTRGVYGNIVEIEDLTELLISTETIDSSQYEVIQLQQKETNVSQVNEVEYDSIQKAIQACGETESTIQILRDTDPGIPIIIEENQNITIDLNGYIVKNYPEIINKGTLKIVDTSAEQTGKMIGLSGIVITNQGNLEIQSGSISDSGYGITNTGTLTISGGNISNNTYGIYNDSSGMTTVTNGTISSNTYGIYNYASTAITNITEGNISSNSYGIYNYNGTTTITSAEMANNEYGIYNASGNVNININITDGTYGIYNAGGTTTVKEGSQISSNTGVYNAKGILNIGERGTMNPDTPIIVGEEYGLVNAGGATVNMYDGQIKGKTGATQGYITYTETGYAVATKTEGEYMIDYLVLSGTISTVAEVNGISFSNLQSAINSVIGEEAQTVKLTNGITTSTTLHIEEGQNIILDMNGKTISSDLDITITNNGNLTIIDSTGNNVAKISSTVGTAISNSGTLSLGQDDGTVTQDLINIEGTTYGIENAGTLNFYDGTINGASAVSGTITSRATGYVIRVTTVNSKERYYLST